MQHPFKILIVHADAAARESWQRALRLTGVEPVFVTSLRAARAVLRREPVGMVFCESHVADGSFRELLSAVKNKRLPLVVTSRVENTGEYLEAMRLGAFDYVAAPIRRTEIEYIVHHALHDSLTAA
jgi:two-component system NtrC family response regulator